mgnify:CR=1 FL=1
MCCLLQSLTPGLGEVKLAQPNSPAHEKAVVANVDELDHNSLMVIAHNLTKERWLSLVLVTTDVGLANRS